jgi:hypothetical protein
MSILLFTDILPIIFIVHSQLLFLPYVVLSPFLFCRPLFGLRLTDCVFIPFLLSPISFYLFPQHVMERSNPAIFQQFVQSSRLWGKPDKGDLDNPVNSVNAAVETDALQLFNLFLSGPQCPIILWQKTTTHSLSQ